MSNPTELRHYSQFPVCGYCNTAWDIIFMRQRSGTSPAEWVGFCRSGGCDPDVWDFIDEGTGWPNGWKMGDHGLPKWYRTGKVPPMPETDNRVFHRRASDDPHAPWRKNMVALANKNQKLKEAKKGINLDDVAWEGEDEEIEDETPDEQPAGDWADDPDLWD